MLIGNLNIPHAYCTNCGTKNKQYKYCPNCGTSFSFNGLMPNDYPYQYQPLSYRLQKGIGLHSAD